MQNQMPSMPSLKTQGTSSSESSGSDLSPSFAEDSVSSDAGSAKENPAIIDPSKSGNLAEVRTVRRGIEVVALEKGFYNQNRIAEGNRFTIKSEEDFGTWFRCIDPVMEGKRLEAIKNKRVRL